MQWQRMAFDTKTKAVMAAECPSVLDADGYLPFLAADLAAQLEQLLRDTGTRPCLWASFFERSQLQC